MESSITSAPSEDPRDELMERFYRSGTLTGKKLTEYIPALLLTNLSTLLISSVDGLVVGNLLGGDSLSSVSIFQPIFMVVSIISLLVTSGASIALSTCIGRNDMERIPRLKKAILWLTVISALIIGILQFPVVALLIRSYHLSPDLERLTSQYAVGCMLALPFGLVSSMGVYQLQILGRMKTLAWLSVMEGMLNLLLDLLFVGPLKMGVAGAGYATLGANLVRSTATAMYIWKKTDLLRFGKVRIGAKDIREILSSGVPDAAFFAMQAFVSYSMMRIVLMAFGDVGGTIQGVCAFCLSVAGMAVSSVTGAMRPLEGLLSGASDEKGLHTLMIQGLIIMAGFVGIIAAVAMIHPKLFYYLHGISEIPDHGLLSLRIYAAFFLFRGADAIYRLYFANRGDRSFSTWTTVAANVLLPVFAFVLIRLFPAPWIWLSYLLSELLIFSASTLRYCRWVQRGRQETKPEEDQLYMSVRPEDAITASRMIRKYADTKGYPARIANRISLCMEEMVSYAVNANGSRDVDIQLLIRFYPDSAQFLMLDNGKCIMLDSDPETTQLVTDNYGLLRKIAKDIKYQYILNMNYTLFQF